MRKIILSFTLLSFLTAPLFAGYIVVLKNGTRYRAKEKWTVRGGKALVNLENGTILQLDPNLIDVQKSDEISKLGLGDVKVLHTAGSDGAPAQAQDQPTLGSITHLRKPKTETPAPPPVQQQPVAPAPQMATPAAAPATASSSPIGNDVLSKFVSAYENVGIYEHTVTSKAPGIVHVELTADTEDQVFKALTATAFMITNLPTATGTRIDMVELFMKTINGGSSGRFQMTPEDADGLVKKTTDWQQYYVQKVLY